MKNKNFIFLFFTGIIINSAGYFLCLYLNLPLFLDCAGSIYNGIILGPFAGGITGFTSNLVFGIVDNPINIPFSIVNGLIGVTSGFITNRYGFYTIKNLLLCILSIVLLSSLLGSFIAVYMFGGITGSTLDIEIIALSEQGYKLLLSSFIIRFFTNIIDKSLCCIAVYIIIKTNISCLFDHERIN